MRSVFDAWSDRVFLRALDDSGVPVSGMLWAFLRDAIEAAKLLGISERTLDRMVKLKGYPEVRLRARKGLKPEPVVNRTMWRA